MDYGSRARFGVAYGFIDAGGGTTITREPIRNRGMNHVECLGDTDNDGISEEA